MTLTHPQTNHRHHEDLAVQPLFGLEGTTIPRDAIPDGELAPDVAYQIIHDELMLDGNARLNLATFVTTWMEPQAERLMAECFDKNMIDKDEYPQTAELEMRCVNILSRLWNAPDASEAIGCSTTGSSDEAVGDICAALDEFQQESGIDVPVHVDGASGAFVAPFLDPDVDWDFRQPRVASINASGHKYGLVYPGVGWIIWRDAEALPKDLIFWVNYLGDNMPTFALNFSRPGAQVVAQYYNLLRLGFEGYARVHGYARDVATRLAGQIEELGPFALLTRGDELPVFAFTLTPEIDNFTVFDVSNALRERGWLVPAYTFPKNRTHLAALRVVVKRGFGHDMADLLVADLRRQLPRLEKQQAPLHEAGATGFHH